MPSQADVARRCARKLLTKEEQQQGREHHDSHSLEFELHVANVWPMYTSLIADAFHRKTEVVCVHMLHKPCILFRVLCLLGSESG
jgi:hypothetical protein